MIIRKEYEYDKLNWLVSAKHPYKQEISGGNNSIKYLYVHESNDESTLKGVCTDGCRLHILNKINEHYDLIKEPGFYKVESNKKNTIELLKVELEDNFPCYNKVIPDKDGNEVFEWNTKLDYRDTISNITLKLFFKFPEYTVLNLDFIKDMIYGINWTVHWYDSQSLVKFFAEDQLSIIMPIFK